MTITELFAHVGDENIEFQRLLEGNLNLTQGRRDGRITFYTGTDKVDDLMRGGKRFLGLVVWLPVERLPEEFKQ